MRNSIALWSISLIITLASAYYQLVTGPTYPLAGSVTFNGGTTRYSLLRSHGGETNALISIPVPDGSAGGSLVWRRYKTQDVWTEVLLQRSGAGLSAELPHQPPAGKLEYHLLLASGSTQIRVPEKGEVVIRFKGDVPNGVLIPHVIAMFLGMLLSTRAGLEVFSREPRLKPLALWALSLLTLGGMILGPIVQKYAFGEFWTGVPFGMDLTDNKTLIAFIAWIGAAASVYKSRRPAMWVLAAAVITLVIFLIPHSMFGSELDYSEMPK